MAVLMRKVALAAVFGIGIPVLAAAADLYSPPPSVPATLMSPQSWAGHYHGLQGGGLWGSGDADGSDGVNIGVFGGWNWQQDALVFGLDVNLNYALGDVDGFNGNVRGRLGLAFADGWLLYGTAGFGGVHADEGFDGGLMVGGGLEYAHWQNASLRLDYAYTDLDEGANAHTLMLGVAIRSGGLLGW